MIFLPQRRPLVWIGCGLALYLVGCALSPDQNTYNPYACPSREPPSLLEAEPISTFWVRLSWTQATPICDGHYRLDRRLDNGLWRECQSVYRLWAIDEVGIPGSETQYRVAAVSGGGYSPIAVVRTFEREHWLPLTGAPDLAVSDLQFLNARLGYACSYDGQVLMTEDAGATWRVLTPTSGPEGELTGLAFVDSLSGMVVGSGGLWLTHDGGLSWTHPVASSRSLNACAFASSRTAVAVGDSMQTYRTLDAGASWSPVHLPGYLNLFAVAFADSTHGWTAGHHGIFATTDAGESWAQVNHQRPDVETFNRLTCSAEGTLLAICRQGILRIAGDSLSWSDVALPEYGGLVVAYADAQTAFAGSWYGLYRSLDDGLSWQPVSWPLFGAVALAFADPATGVAVGEAHDPADGRFLRTIDGGAEGH